MAEPGAKRPRTAGLSGERERLRALLRSGALLHPLNSAAGENSILDLVHALTIVWGADAAEAERSAGAAARVRRANAEGLAARIGGAQRRHVVLILCDGMGKKALRDHLPADSFLRRHDHPDDLRTAFPATTPAILTSLGTGAWPGQHGGAGWKLRETRRPPSRPAPAAPAPDGDPNIYLDVLPWIDNRTKASLNDFGYDASADVLLRKSLLSEGLCRRRLATIVTHYAATDFSEWQVGARSVPTWDSATGAPQLRDACRMLPIPETSTADMGTQKGVDEAIAAFSEGCGKIRDAVAAADRAGLPSYTYLYTAHPDKHMHPLGVDHWTVRDVVRGFDRTIQKLWEDLAGKDVAMMVIADHGHISVAPADQVRLPGNLRALLEYANLGVHGTGRHACFHCKPGKAAEFAEKFLQTQALRDHFILLPVDEAAQEGLFGPPAAPGDGWKQHLHPRTRERLGDFIAIATSLKTLVKDEEAEAFAERTQGAHGSLLPEEMRIPFVLLTPEMRGTL
eukprot:TRINITY_DN11865_c0_g2_i1.p1 TRINITY_DN11865_c0_g2~~TRINITY_DN11865_c0_g2_i1.p1  ORF type:complete len:536 (+),score=169.60 TRINITY_DN11865_c0_g2_i1:79-1608(+)